MQKPTRNQRELLLLCILVGVTALGAVSVFFKLHTDRENAARTAVREAARRAVEANEDWADRALYEIRKVGEGWMVMACPMTLGANGVPSLDLTSVREIVIDTDTNVSEYVQSAGARMKSEALRIQEIIDTNESFRQHIAAGLSADPRSGDDGDGASR